MSLTRSALLPVAVRANLAVDSTSQRITDGLAQRARRLRDDGEEGSQVVEYALIGGVGAAICGGIVALFARTNLLETLLSAVIRVLVNAVRSWFT